MYIHYVIYFSSVNLFLKMKCFAPILVCKSPIMLMEKIVGMNMYYDRVMRTSINIYAIYIYPYKMIFYSTNFFVNWQLIFEVSQLLHDTITLHWKLIMLNVYWRERELLPIKKWNDIYLVGLSLHCNMW